MDVALTRTLRFYPDEIAPFPGEPRIEDFGVDFIGPEVGYGVVSRRFFAPGDEIFALSGVVIAEITQFSLQLPDGGHIHDPWFMGRSCTTATRTPPSTWNGGSLSRARRYGRGTASPWITPRPKTICSGSSRASVTPRSAAERSRVGCSRTAGQRRLPWRHLPAAAAHA